MVDTLVTAWKCSKCGHIWMADQRPARCAKCFSRKWAPRFILIQEHLPTEADYGLSLGQTLAPGWRCDACNHEWLRRKETPKRCANPTCKSSKWNAGKPKPVMM